MFKYFSVTDNIFMSRQCAVGLCSGAGTLLRVSVAVGRSPGGCTVVYSTRTVQLYCTLYTCHAAGWRLCWPPAPLSATHTPLLATPAAGGATIPISSQAPAFPHLENHNTLLMISKHCQLITCFCKVKYLTGQTKYGSVTQYLNGL